MENKYKDGKIYKLTDNTNGNIYYGSTYLPLEIRLGNHNAKFKQFIKNQDHWRQSFRILINNDYIIEKIEDYPCNSQRELEKREDYYINNFNCINKKRAYITEEQYKESRKNYNKKNKLENNDIYKKQLLTWKRLAEKNTKKKEEVERIKCPNCNKILRIDSLSRHKRTKYCLNYIESSV